MYVFSHTVLNIVDSQLFELIKTMILETQKVRNYRSDIETKNYK